MFSRRIVTSRFLDEILRPNNRRHKRAYTAVRKVPFEKSKKLFGAIVMYGNYSFRVVQFFFKKKKFEMSF